MRSEFLAHGRIKPMRWIAAVLVLASLTGCEITASAYVQQEYNTDPRVFSKPDGVARVEVKIVKTIGR
jgi:hypothetical protein